MRYKKLGRTGLLVSEICLGTMTFGQSAGAIWNAIGGLSELEAIDLVKTAFDAGVNFFDTADAYSDGLSEMFLGRAIKACALKRDEIVVATKGFGRLLPLLSAPASAAEQQERERRKQARNISGLSRKHLFDAVDASLTRLELDYIDLYQVHAIDPLTPLEETLEALDDIVRSGRVRYIGLCNYAAWQVAKALGISMNRGLSRYESLQVYYSIAGRDVEREIVPLAGEEELAILPWSPLAGGLLSGKFHRGTSGPSTARRASFDFPPVDRERAYSVLDAIRPMAERRDVTPARIALAWLLHQKHVTSVIIGSRTKEQLHDNLQAATVTLDEEELNTLDKVSALPVEYPGWVLQAQSADRLSQVRA